MTNSDSADLSQPSDAPPAWLPRALRLAERLHRSLANGASDDDLNDAATLCQILLDAIDSPASSALLAGQRDGERLMYNAVMNAIERTVKVCDAQEREKIPFEARVIDYADILAKSLAANRAPSAGASDDAN